MQSSLRSRQVFIEFVRAAPLAVVATVSADGAPEAALVSGAATADGDLLFTTATAAGKVTNLGHRARAALVVGCVGPASLQVEGPATIETGLSRMESGRVYSGAFPGSRALVDGFSIVRVRPGWIRQYDTASEPPEVLEGRPARVG